MKNFIKEYWWALVLGAFSAFLSDDKGLTITKFFLITIFAIILLLIDHFIVRKFQKKKR